MVSLKKELCSKCFDEQREKKDGHVPLSPVGDTRAEMGRMSRGSKAQCV